MSVHIVYTHFYRLGGLQSSKYGAKADIWALGCVLYELCGLRRPFEANGLMAVMFKIINAPPPDLPLKSLAHPHTPAHMRAHMHTHTQVL